MPRGGLAGLLAMAERVVSLQSTGEVTGSCSNWKQPCLQRKTVFEKLDPRSLCLSCRAYWYSAMALEAIKELAQLRRKG